MALWLEESRVHDPNLYISSLPDAYLPQLLERIFQGKKVRTFHYIFLRYLWLSLEKFYNRKYCLTQIVL